ncbi:MAG: hypothetical protein ABI239_05995 [Aquihabitans sp.]
MTTHSDLPTRAQLGRLFEHRGDASVTIYLPTTRLSQEGHAMSLTLAQLGAEARRQLEESADPSAVEGIEAGINDLVEDEEFWKFQADSLAVFATPDRVQTFRLPNELTEMVEVSDRFHLKPLLRSTTFPQAAYVLRLSKAAVQLLEIGPDAPPVDVPVPDMPDDAWGSGGNHFFKARDRHYVRQIDHALRGVIGNSDLPLIVAATESIDGLFRAVNTYPHLVETRWAGNAEETTDAELAADARTVLDAHYAAELAEIAELFGLRASQGRAATDVAEIARLATIGAVDTLLVDIDASVPGSVDDETGAVTFDDDDDAVNYGVVDEIARRVYLTGGRILAVRAPEVPGGGTAAAILRYAV